MSTIKLKYIHRFVDRHRKVRHYFRRAHHKSVALPGEPGSREFMRAYALALEGTTAAKLEIGETRSKAGTISALVAAYYKSPDFEQLADQTKITYRGIIEKFRNEHGDKPISGLQAHHIRAIVGALRATPSASNHLLMRIHTLMQFAVEHNMRRDDPTVGIRKMKAPTEGHHTWTEDEIQMFESRWPLGCKERLAFDLLLYTAQRSSDVRRMGARHLSNGRIMIRQQKTKTLVDIPIHPDLKVSLNATPHGTDALLLSKAGVAYTSAGFLNFISDAIRSAGLPPGVSAHGLRKAAARRLAEGGCTVHEIMSITGHLSVNEVQRYTKAADRARLSEAAMKRMLTRQNVATPTERLPEDDEEDADK